jgi:acetolactate synthase-1/2/3 large subunit
LHLARAVNERLPGGSQVLADGADIATWMYGGIRIRGLRGFMDHYPMGAMGSCTALAVGAAAALKELHAHAGEDAAADAEPPTVLITGDGAIGFHPAELHAAALAGLNLKVIIGNDGAWGTELHGQLQAIGRDINTRLGQLNYEKLADVFGGQGIRIETMSELEDKLDLAFRTPGLVIVNVLIDPEAGMELKHNPDVRMILFSDILSGQADLGKLTGAI